MAIIEHHIKLFGTVTGAGCQHSLYFLLSAFTLCGNCVYTICLQVLTVLCNIAEKGPAYCQHLWPGPLLLSLLEMLAFSDAEVVGQSLELLQLLFLYRPEVSFLPWPHHGPFPSSPNCNHFSGPG